MTTFPPGTELIRTRHIHGTTILGAFLLWVGLTASLTVVGMVIGIPMAIAGLGILTTPHPH